MQYGIDYMHAKCIHVYAHAHYILNTFATRTPNIHVRIPTYSILNAIWHLLNARQMYTRLRTHPLYTMWQIHYTHTKYTRANTQLFDTKRNIVFIVCTPNIHVHAHTHYILNTFTARTPIIHVRIPTYSILNAT